MIDSSSVNLLGGHITHGSHYGAGIGKSEISLGGDRRVDRLDIAFLQLGQSEIEDLHPSVFRDEHVFRFEITMHDAPIMGRGQTRSDLLRITKAAAHRQWALVQLLP